MEIMLIIMYIFIYISCLPLTYNPTSVLDTQFSLLKVQCQGLAFVQSIHTEHTLFLSSHTHRNWDYAVSGARLMSHGGHSPLSPIRSPLHVFFLSLILYLFLQPLLIIYYLLRRPCPPVPPPSPTVSLNLSHSLPQLHPSLPNHLPSLILTHLSPSVSYYTHSPVICSMWNLPQKDISSWTAVSEKTERNVCSDRKIRIDRYIDRWMDSWINRCKI